MPIKLNLGCGEKYKKGYVNIDIREPCDLKHDLRDPLPFDNNSVDEIFSEGSVVCLFSFREWEMLKNELVRVLKPGGKLEIECVDLEYAFKAFLNNTDGLRWSWWRQTVFGGQHNEHEFCKNGFTYEKLVTDLSVEGMATFSREQVEPIDIHLVCYKQPLRIKTNMKILIGTPIHISKDYVMERWLENVSKLEYPVDLLLVDTSVGLDYVEKVKEYCDKYGIKNYKIKHLEIGQYQPWAEKTGRSWEMIRQEILANDYDAWLSWECDRIIPVDALGNLASIMEKGNFMMVNPNSWRREGPADPDVGFGCALIRRDALEKYGFLLEYPDMPNCWAMGESWFKKRILKEGGSYIEIFGAIGPILHLKK